MDTPDALETSFKDDLEKLAESRHCFFCTKLWKDILNFYAQLPYGLVHDAEKRRAYGEEGALCPFHLWQLASMASSAGLSLVLAEMTQETSRRLSACMGRERTSAHIFGTFIDSKRSCLVCSYTRQVEKQHLNYFQGLLAGREGLEAYEKSKGFCLRHVALTIDGLDEKSSESIVMHSVSRFSELSENLLNFSQNCSASRRAQLQPDERHAVSRALIQLGGTKYLHYLLMR